MPDLESMLGELRGVGSRPLSDVPDVGEVAARARAIRRRRMTARVAPVVVLVAALAGLGGWVQVDRGDAPVAVDPTVPEVPDAGAQEEPLRVVPDTGLVDGQVVEIELADDPGGPLVAVQCAVGVRSEQAAVGECNGEATTVRSGESGPVDPVRVTRFQFRGMGGAYDCAERTWRCYLVVAPGTPEAVDFGAAVSVPIWFVDDGRGPSVTVSDARPGNGEVITVSGSGLPWNSQVWIAQCRPDRGDDLDRCDALRGKTTTTDDHGNFETRFQVSEVIRLWSDWQETPCRECVVQVAVGTVRAETDVQVQPNLEPVRPRFEIVEDGPYTPGQPVTVVGSGFQIELENAYEAPYPEWCILGTEPLVCGSPGEPYETVETGEGEYRYEGFLMPHGLFGERCLTEPCVVTWIRGEGTPPSAYTSIDLRLG